MPPKLRVVALADSLSMPRPEREGGTRVRWDETWPKRLEARLQARGIEAEVINCGKRSRTALDLEVREHINFKEPDVVVLQVGIVDCAPRVFSQWEKKWLGSSFVPHRVRTWLTTYRSARRAKLTARNPLAKVYTSPRAYRRALLQFKELLASRTPPIRVIVLPTLVHSALSTKSAGYASNASLYNGILQEVWGNWLISPEEIIGGDEARTFIPDGMHLSPAGNDRLAELLCNKIIQ